MDKGLTAYYAGDLAKSISSFSNLAKWPDFRVAAQLFIERCELLMQKPMEDWNGVWAYDAKERALARSMLPAPISERRHIVLADVYASGASGMMLMWIF